VEKLSKEISGFANSEVDVPPCRDEIRLTDKTEPMRTAKVNKRVVTLDTSAVS
jgi:hypothetical protein